MVFAGAWVSVPAPSNLPDFEELADNLAQATTKREKKEFLERFLGRLDPALHIQCVHVTC